MTLIPYQELIRGNREAIATVNQLTQKLLLAEKNEDFEPELVDEIPEDAKMQAGWVDDITEQPEKTIIAFR